MKWTVDKIAICNYIPIFPISIWLNEAIINVHDMATTAS